MKLIDVDNIKITSLRAQGGREYATGFDDGVDYVLRKIYNSPIINAIPVEWLIGKTQHPDSYTRGSAKWILGCWKHEQEAGKDDGQGEGY